MKILFCTNLPSPYRVDFFNELGKCCELTVCYERRNASNRDEKWISNKALTYEEVYLNLRPLGTDKSYGSALRKYIAEHEYDNLIMTNYVSPACIEAVVYCRVKKIPYWIEYDGGFNKDDILLKKICKRILIEKAVGHLTTCDEHIKYLTGLGIKNECIYKYPFSSISKRDILKETLTYKEKVLIRDRIGIKEDKVIVSVGRFNYNDGKGKGFDLLFHIAEKMQDIGFYIIGDEPTERFIKWKNNKDLRNIHFIPFKRKKELFDYYLSADIMLMLTRGDVWGLVVNESMACGLPVITTDRCMAGVEMICNLKNGYIVPANTYQLAIKIIRLFFDNLQLRQSLSQCCLKTAQQYTVEKMAKRHIEIIK